MRQEILRPVALAVLALALAAGAAANVYAQGQRDQSDQRDQHDQNGQNGQKGAPGEQREQPNQNDRDAQRPAARPDEHPAARHDDHGDQVAQYRHAHPGAAARCHDGFFTRTTDRKRACSKHGGIEIWLLL